VSARHHCRDLSLFGNQERLKLTSAQRSVDASVFLVRRGAVDLGGDCVKPTDALAYRGMSAGKRFREDTISLSNRAVLTRESCLARLNGNYRKSGLLRHGFNLFIMPADGRILPSHSGRRIAT
jgi:hypothetical protein